MRNRPSSSPDSNDAPEALRASPAPWAGVQAWYREPWPWLIMAGPLIVVIASMVTVWHRGEKATTAWSPATTTSAGCS